MPDQEYREYLARHGLKAKETDEDNRALVEFVQLMEDRWVTEFMGISPSWITRRQAEACHGFWLDYLHREDLAKTNEDYFNRLVSEIIIMRAAALLPSPE